MLHRLHLMERCVFSRIFLSPRHLIKAKGEQLLQIMVQQIVAGG